MSPQRHIPNPLPPDRSQAGGVLTVMERESDKEPSLAPLIAGSPEGREGARAPLLLGVPHN